MYQPRAVLGAAQSHAPPSNPRTSGRPDPHPLRARTKSLEAALAQAEARQREAERANMAKSRFPGACLHVLIRPDWHAPLPAEQAQIARIGLLVAPPTPAQLRRLGVPQPAMLARDPNMDGRAQGLSGRRHECDADKAVEHRDATGGVDQVAGLNTGACV